MFNAATNNEAFSSSFSVTDFLNPKSPFTFLAHGDLVGFVLAFFPNSNNTVTTTITGQVTFQNCNFEPSLLGTSNFVLCDVPPNLGYLPQLSLGKPENYIGIACVAETISSCDGYMDVTNGTLSSPGVELKISVNCAPASGTSLPSVGDSSVVFAMDCNEITASKQTTDLSAILGGFAFIGSFIVSIVLVAMALGLTIQGQFFSSGGGVGANAQATRLAQTFGFGLLLWNITSSEFATVWGAFGFGVGAVIIVTFTIMEMVGLWERTLMYPAS